MKNTKKILAGIMAFAMTAGFAACGGDDDQGTGDGGNGGGNTEEVTTTSEAVTTTAATVAINEEGLKEGEDEVLANAMSQLQDVELDRKSVV